MSRLDHLVYAVPELRAGCDELERLLGVRPAPGGRHERWGTANALLALGPAAYLEVVGPDPEASAAPAVFALDGLVAPRLVAWAVRVHGLAGEEMSRLRPDGTELRWRMTPPRTGAIPFLVDWGDSPHPADGAPGGVVLESFSVESPDHEGVESELRALGLAVSVTAGRVDRLSATLAGPAGRLVL